MKRKILACLLIVCVSIFSLSSCQQAFGKEGRLSDQDIYRFQREYGTAGGMQADGNMWMIVQDAVLLVKLVEEEECYLSITSQGGVEINKEIDYASSQFSYQARIWTLRVLAVADGALQGEERLIRVLDLTGAITGNVEDAPAFEPGQVFACGVSYTPRTEEPLDPDVPPYTTFHTVVYRIVPGGYVFRCDPNMTDMFDGYRLDYFFNLVRLLREDDWLFQDA